MPILAIIAGLTGATLGLRFKVLILIPAFALSIPLTALVGHAQGTGFVKTLLAEAIVIAALQIGYLVGVLTRGAVAAARLSRRPAANKRPIQA